MPLLQYKANARQPETPDSEEATMRSESVDPTDAPPPLTAGLRRAGLIGDGEEFDLLGTPPPVRPLYEPEYITVMLNGKPVRVRTTPPPPQRRMPPASLPSHLLSMAPPAEPEAATVDEVQHDLSRGPALGAVLACAILLAGFAAILLAG